MKTKLTFLLILLLSATSFAQDNWKTLKQDNYSIMYPESWLSSDQKPQPTIQFVLMAEEASQKEDLFRENINLNTENLAGQSFSLDEYAKLALEQVKTQIPSAKFLSKDDIKLGNEAAKEVVWTADFGGSITLKFKQTFIINGDTVYVLTFSASEEEFDQYIEVGTKILYSFKFTK